MLKTDKDKKVGTQVGVISDTHGLLRSEAMEVLTTSDLILHAGDIGKPEVLESLRAIAPVIAVRGNIDKDGWAEAIPTCETVKVEDVSIYVLHILKELTLDPVTSGLQVVISGHSHKPIIEKRDGTLFVNPGSAGPRRFKLPISVARLHINRDVVQAEIIELAVN